MKIIDPERRLRFLKAVVASMVVSTIFGAAGYLSAWMGIRMQPRPIHVIHREGLVAGMNTAAIAFWVLFPILLLTKGFKSVAVLDMERRVRLAEELFARSKRERKDHTQRTPPLE